MYYTSSSNTYNSSRDDMITYAKASCSVRFLDRDVQQSDK